MITPARTRGPRIYVGIDPATKTGWGAVDEQGKVIVAQTVDSSREHSLALMLAASIETWLKRVDGVDYRLAVEQAHYDKTKSLTPALVGARNAGVAECVAMRHLDTSRIWRCQPSEWRAVLGWGGADRARAKTEALFYCQRFLGHVATDDNEAEGCCIAEALRKITALEERTKAALREQMRREAR